MTTIRSEKRGVLTLQYLLFTKSNYAAWLTKMHVNLQAQDMWDVIEHGDNVEERKDRTTLASIYQAVLEDVLLMLA